MVRHVALGPHHRDVSKHVISIVTDYFHHQYQVVFREESIQLFPVEHWWIVTMQRLFVSRPVRPIWTYSKSSDLTRLPKRYSSYLITLMILALLMRGTVHSLAHEALSICTHRVDVRVLCFLANVTPHRVVLLRFELPFCPLSHLNFTFGR